MTDHLARPLIVTLEAARRDQRALVVLPPVQLRLEGDRFDLGPERLQG